ncbi:MAG: Rpn family recombination-promoting nuclease/putative transposase [Bacteroidota bacterium]
MDPHMLARNLQYNASLFLKHRKQGHKKLPLVVNIVVYNGSQTHYPYHADLYEYFEHPELARSVMSKSYILVNLAKTLDRDLLSHGLCGPMELLLKRAGNVNFVSWLQRA